MTIYIFFSQVLNYSLPYTHTLSVFLSLSFHKLTRTYIQSAPVIQALVYGKYIFNIKENEKKKKRLQKQQQQQHEEEQLCIKLKYKLFKSTLFMLSFSLFLSLFIIVLFVRMYDGLYSYVVRMCK